MDSAMRDLEQIQEQSEGQGKPLLLVGLLVAVTIGVVFAMGLWVGDFGAPEAAQSDPLAHLDRADGLAPVEEVAAEPEPPVEARDLSFPEALTEDPPEMAAALAAAAAELAHPEPLPTSLAAFGAVAAPVPVAPPPPEALPAVLPAGVAASPEAEDLVRTAARDPLVAAALPPEPDARSAAPAGHDGLYTVQVISYDSPEGAQAFAAGLRARGHRAFVLSAQVEGRGTMYRVRVGPFETMREAEAYRREFERNERMNTIVVRRRDAD